jgi:Flp pilus assembly CpaF family ATPase
LCQQPPNNFTEGAANTLIASAVDFIIHLGCDEIEEDGGRIVRFERYVSEIVEVAGCDGGRVQTNPIFTPGPDGRAEADHPLSTNRHRRLAKVGYHHQAVTG